MPVCQQIPNVDGNCVDQDQTPAYPLGPGCKTKCCDPCTDAESCCSECRDTAWLQSNSCNESDHQEGGDPCIERGERTQNGDEWGTWELKEDDDNGNPYGEEEITNEEDCISNQNSEFGCKKGDGERPCMPDFSAGGNQLRWPDYLAASLAGFEWAGFSVPKDCVGCKCKGKKCKKCKCRWIPEPTTTTTTTTTPSAGATGKQIKILNIFRHLNELKENTNEK